MKWVFGWKIQLLSMNWGQTKKNISELPHMQKEFETAAEELLVNGSHTSVLLWSLGHDCAWGVNFGIIRDRIRELDDYSPDDLPFANVHSGRRTTDGCMAGS